MISNNPIRAVVFDLDNTLYDYDAAHAPAFRALTDFACREFGLTPEEFVQRHRAAEKELGRRCGANCAAVHNRLIRYQVLLEGLGRPIGRAPEMSRLYWSTLLNAMKPYPGAIRMLEQLREMGLTVGIGTNMTADKQYEKLIRIGAMERIDFLVTSEEVTAEKPDRRLFDACAIKARCEPGHCLFVGDSLEKDVKGALAAGMRAAWFHPDRDGAEGPPGVPVLREMSELIELIKAM